jgi:putative transposase
MTDQFKNKYRIPSARLQSWDYGWNAAYFVTICTKDRECFFGNIVNGVMNLSGAGIIVDILWHETKNHATNIELGEFIVMPNHLHGIIILNADDNMNTTAKSGLNVETGHALSLQQQSLTPGEQRFRNQGKNTLSSIVGGYKSAVTKHANRLKFNFAWQTRFHDHIIRDEQSFQTISNYIINNPMSWTQDKFFK